MNINKRKPTIFVIVILLLLSINIGVIPTSVLAGSYDGIDLAEAMLVDPSTLIASNYYDRDNDGHRQAAVLSNLGSLYPTNGTTFALFSTGIAGGQPVTTDGLNPGDERGTYFKNKYGHPRDEATLTMLLQVPEYMHYLYYDVQFLSAEYPEYIGAEYNDELIITVDSPAIGVSSYIINVNSGDFILESNDIPDTGFDIFATSGNPMLVDWVDTIPQYPGADAGATALIGREHPVSPLEQVTVTINIKDVGDSQFDSAAFIDNIRFTGYAKTEIISRKTVNDIDGGFVECGDTLRYRISISNIGSATQQNNDENEFEDDIPLNTQYVSGSVSATSGIAEYSAEDDMILWNGAIPSESSVAIEFDVIVDTPLENGTAISNQGRILWDKSEDGINDAVELTDDPSRDDGIDQDGDGETGDDDPTKCWVFSFESPSYLVEDFSDDISGNRANQSYFDIYTWFETDISECESIFSVASSYHYATPRSFKTQLRSTDIPQEWRYNLTVFEKDISWWEIWFRCGNASEAGDQILNFRDENDNTVAKIKIEYISGGTDPLTPYMPRLRFWSGSNKWWPLESEYVGGYLFDAWYKLRIQQNGTSNIDYLLYQAGTGLIDQQQSGCFSTIFTHLTSIEWSSTQNPAVSPMIFWDEHKIGLI